MATTDEAIQLCRRIEEFAPSHGCHVALTGGCLYKSGDRKDIDILFYRIRQVSEIDIDGLSQSLEKIGIHGIRGGGWIFKANYRDMEIDMFFPEEAGGGPYGKEESEK